MTIARDDVRCAGSREVIPFKTYIRQIDPAGEDDSRVVGHFKISTPG
jgi:hypothetical protein